MNENTYLHRNALKNKTLLLAVGKKMESENSGNNKGKKGNKKNKGNTSAKQDANTQNGMKKDLRPPRIKFKKRGGTSGATGQLYESKLLSLVLFRCLTDEEIEKFLLGSNIRGVGDLDDICLGFSYKGKPVAAFIQSKHKDDSSKGVTDITLYSPKSKVNLVKCFDSYMQVRNKFMTENDNNDIFSDKIEDVKLNFIVYTSAVNKISKEKIKIIDEIDWFCKLRKIISCKDYMPRQVDVFQLAYDDNDIDILLNVLIDEQVEIIAKGIVECLAPKAKNFDVFNNFLNILVPDVVKLSENNNSGGYVADINPSLFYATDEVIIKLSYAIFRHVSANRNLGKDQQEMCLKEFLYNDDDTCRTDHLSKLIGSTVTFDEKNDKLIFSVKLSKERKEDLIQKFGKKLNKTDVSKNMIAKALHTAGEELLKNTCIEIPNNVIDINELKQYEDKKSFFLAEKRLAEDFLTKLYFYTNQGQENDVADKLVNDMSKYFENLKSQFYQNRIKADIAFLKFHDKVQKWWLLSDKSYYLTKTCDYLDPLPNEIAQSFVDMLDFKYTHEISRFSIKFKPELEETIKLNNKSKITNIVTNSLLLTTTKLKQFFKKIMFIDFQNLYYLQDNEWKTLHGELKSKRDFSLVLVCDKINEQTSAMVMWLIGKVIDAFENHIVIVSHDSLNDISHVRNLDIKEIIIDENITFADLTIETQNKLLKYEVDFQGHAILLNKLFKNDSNTINTDIIHRILNNLPIVIGPNVTNSNYENIKEVYVPRALISRNEFENIKTNDYSLYIVTNRSYYNLLCTFKDSDKDMNIIAAEPGMGKSTILTHLSIETKKQYPEIWIVRFNLLDYCDDFQYMDAEVDRTAFLQLIIKSQFGNVGELFIIEDLDGNVSLKYNDNNTFKLFELDFFLQCYNNRNIIFVFDGFDEICPDYQTQVTSFIKNATHDQGSNLSLTESFSASERPKRFQVWLTSRPYNVIIQHLEEEFGTSFILKPLSKQEQYLFYEKYWNLHLKANETDMKQFSNIESFFDFMTQFRNKLTEYSDHFRINDVPLYEMYVAAVHYYRHQILHMPIKVDKEKILNEWITESELTLKLARTSLTRGTDISNAQQIVGVPLYMDMAASYFVSQITSGIQQSPTDWDLGFTTFSYYKRFVELKLKERFITKNDMKISRPDVKAMCNTERDHFISIHKRLAFYSMVHRSKHYLKRLLTKPEMVEIKRTIEKIKNGKEKTGLIERIHNNVPRFIHLTFAEFFAVEFIVDLIISKKIQTKVIMDFTMNYLLRQGTIGLMTIFDQKLRNNDVKLNKVLSEPAVKKIVFDIMMEQKEMTEMTVWMHDEYLTLNVEAALTKAIDNNLNNVVLFIIRSLDGNLNEDNIDSVINLFGRSFFIGTMLMNNPEAIEHVLDQIRLVDVSKINDVVNVCKLDMSTDNEIQNADILNELRKEIKDMATPHYSFDDFDEAF